MATQTGPKTFVLELDEAPDAYRFVYFDAGIDDAIFLELSGSRSSSRGQTMFKASK